tara:strand:- start:911 stop:1117 length:207 start_codon:yes stop_codon:yes gene_type:complete
MKDCSFEEWCKKVNDFHNKKSRDKVHIRIRNYYAAGHSIKTISHRFRLIRDCNNFMNERAVENICMSP